MQRRLLASGERLWAQGEPALCMGVVERGKLAVRTPERVLGVVFPGMVLGESAIFGLEGTQVMRTASVVALEDDTVVTEYPAELVRETFGAGVPRLVLRTLSGQICRNALLTIAASPQPTATSPILSLIRGVVQSERQARKISTWEEFLVAFRILFNLREGSDAMRRETPECLDVPRTILEASKTVKELFKAKDTVAYLEAFLEAEQERYRTAATSG